MTIITLRRVTSYTVRIELPLSAGAGERASEVTGRLDASLPAQAGHGVRDAQLDSEIRRGRRLARVRVSMTADGDDPGSALVAAMNALRQAIGADAPAWDLAGTTATVAPVPA